MIKLQWCDSCKNKTKMNGFHLCCNAFPDGIPYTFDRSKDHELKTCNNGIGYEEIKEPTNNSKFTT